MWIFWSCSKLLVIFIRSSWIGHVNIPHINLFFCNVVLKLGAFKVFSWADLNWPKEQSTSLNICVLTTAYGILLQPAIFDRVCCCITCMTFGLMKQLQRSWCNISVLELMHQLWYLKNLSALLIHTYVIHFSSSSMTLLFYYLSPLQNDTDVTSQCMQ